MPGAQTRTSSAGFIRGAVGRTNQFMLELFRQEIICSGTVPAAPHTIENNADI